MTEVKKLYRDTETKLIVGVCAGIAEYFDLDVSLVRIGVVILGLAGGSAILAYLVAMFVIPPKPTNGVNPTLKQ